MHGIIHFCCNIYQQCAGIHQPPPRKTKSPHQRNGLFVASFPRERRYAALGYLLLFSFEPAVKPGVSALPLGLASHPYPTTFHRNRNAPDGGYRRSPNVQNESYSFGGSGLVSAGLGFCFCKSAFSCSSVLTFASASFLAFSRFAFSPLAASKSF
jgi:hypothetical protein